MLPTLQILQQAQTSSILKEEITEKINRFLPYEEKIRGQFGLDFVNSMERVRDELHETQLDDTYTAGFLAAWKLWAEVTGLTGRQNAL